MHLGAIITLGDRSWTGPALLPQQPLDRRDHYAHADVGQESVVDPMPGVAEHAVDILDGHVPRVPDEAALGPIGRDPSIGWNSCSTNLRLDFASQALVNKLCWDCPKKPHRKW